MAKSAGFFGLRRGSTKSLTFQVLDGQQITKDRVTSVKNPRSSAQMSQRFKNYSVVQAYSLLKRICDHSFEGVTYGAKSYQKFLSENYRNFVENYPGYFVGSAYKSNKSAPGPWIISLGTLSLPIASNGVMTAATHTVATINKVTLTVADIHAALGLDNADFVTFVSPQWQVGSDGLVYRDELVVARIYKSNYADSTAVTADNFATIFQVESNSDADGITLTIGESDATIAISLVGDISTDAEQSWRPYVAIASKKTDSGWLRSTAQLPAVDVTDVFTAVAFTTWPEGSSYVLNGGAGYGMDAVDESFPEPEET